MELSRKKTHCESSHQKCWWLWRGYITWSFNVSWIEQELAILSSWPWNNELEFQLLMAGNMRVNVYTSIVLEAFKAENFRRSVGSTSEHYMEKTFVEWRIIGWRDRPKFCGENHHRWPNLRLFSHLKISHYTWYVIYQYSHYSLHCYYLRLLILVP